MMIKKSHSSRSTEENFRGYLKKRALFMAGMIIFGTGILLWMNTVNWNGTHEQDYTRGFFWGFGIALISIGAVRLIRIIRCVKMPEKFQKAYTEYTDERNQFVLMKTYQTTAYIFIMLMAIATLVVNFIGMPPVISSTLAACIGVFSLILTITYRIMNRRY